MPRTRRLVLVGGGHAHVEVLRAAARAPFGGDIVLVSPYPEQYYTGLLPAQLRGAIPDRALTVDLRALCAEANARFIEAPATRIEGSRDSVVVHTAGEPVPGDVCSLDIGSIASGLDTPGVREHAFTVRPQVKWRALVNLLGEITRAGANAPFTCCVVGGGAGGVELALAIVARAKHAGQNVQCTLVAGDELLPNLGPRFAARAATVLRANGVQLVTGRHASSVHGDHVLLDDDTRIDAALTVWAAGASAPALARESGLPVDGEGFFKVDASLRSVTGEAVFGAGDCVSLVESPWAAKSGVYAVRAAPVLAANLRSVMHSPPREPRLYDAQQSALQILDTGDGKALLYWHGWSSYSTWALRFKRRLDTDWVERYRVK